MTNTQQTFATMCTRQEHYHTALAVDTTISPFEKGLQTAKQDKPASESPESMPSWLVIAENIVARFVSLFSLKG